jgi:hypothetical protein
LDERLDRIGPQFWNKEDWLTVKKHMHMESELSLTVLLTILGP